MFSFGQLYDVIHILRKVSIDNKGLQIIEFDDGEIKLDINIDSLDVTICLSQLDMSALFETTPDNTR